MTSVIITSPGYTFSIRFIQFSPECGLTSVEWVPVNSTVDVNPNAGGGKRIFPDKQTANDATNRKIVRARITTTLGPNVPVYFRAFDVDDPSTDASPVDANAGAGNDNRGAPQYGTLSAGSALTDANGIAQVEFTVTMQPGDNFLIASSNDQAYLNGVVLDGGNLRDSYNVCSLPAGPRSRQC
jgi:hypothetical protein